MPWEHEGGGHRRNHGLGQQLWLANMDLVDEWSGRRRENSNRTYNCRNVLPSRNTGGQFLLFMQCVWQEWEDISYHDDCQPTHCSNTVNVGICWKCIACGPFHPLSLPRNPTGHFDCEAAWASQITHRHQWHWLHTLTQDWLSWMAWMNAEILWLISVFYDSFYLLSTNAISHCSSSLQADQNRRFVKLSMNMPWVFLLCGWCLMTNTSWMKTFILSWYQSSRTSSGDTLLGPASLLGLWKMTLNDWPKSHRASSFMHQLS